MSIIGESLLRGADEALAYARGQTAGHKTHKIKVPQQVKVRTIRIKLRCVAARVCRSFWIFS